MQRVAKSLNNSKILLGVTGSVAAYKAVDLVRRLKDKEADVTVIMTSASSRFVTPLLFESVSGNKVHTDMFDNPFSHINLARDNDILLVAPATANSIGKFACGIADNLLSTCFMAFKGVTIISPAMNWRMYDSPAVRMNLERLSSWGAAIIPPVKGNLACGEEGVGKLPDVETIIDYVLNAITAKDMCGMKVLVTAGPTREYIDPVRFITNKSSGKMGYAIASCARKRGAEVVLVSGPASLPPPIGVDLISVETTEEMKSAVMEHAVDSNVVVMASAPADFTPESKADAKLYKADVKTIAFKSTSDILKAIGSLDRKPFLVGFSAEYGRNIERAREKLTAKSADFIVFNDVSEPGSGFEVDTNKVAIIGHGFIQELPLMSKEDVADKILDLVVKGLKS